MASVQEPEVQFAQRLASNERPVRTKALRKLRKYINVRSQKAAGGFTGDELLKLWKGLFYCVWMQDKPQLQEELSSRISSLIHSFQDVDGQMLYLESFMQTFKREWTGIDRLRMDKFYQLVRFMFRQSFEMLKRKNWASSDVSRFLELLTVQLLQSGSEAPIGLQLHILDVYMTELAAAGAAELTAEQNLTFIDPFCITAAKTKDTICSSIFSTIMDQAPLAIEDLIKELKAAEASDADSGQASEEDDEGPGGRSRKLVGETNGDETKEEEELHSAPHDDDDIEAVLQFDYGALAERLFQLSKQSNTPSKSRQKLYSIIRQLQNLSKGIFPKDEFPEEVSTDEDDDMFCSRKRMKRKVEEDEGRPSFKKRETKEASAPKRRKKDSAEDGGEKSDLTVKKKKRRRRKKKAGAKRSESMAEQTGDAAQSATSSVSITEAAAETLLLSEVKEEPSVTGGTSEEQETSGTDAQRPSSADAAASGKKKKRRGKKRKTQTEGIKVQSQVSAEGEGLPLEGDAATNGEKKTSPEEANGSAAGLQAGSTPSRKKMKRKKLQADEDAKIEAIPEITLVGEEPSGDAVAVPLKKKKDDQEEETSPAAHENEATPMKRRKKTQEEAKTAAEEDAGKPVVATTTPAKKKKKRPSPKDERDKCETEVQVGGVEDAEIPTSDTKNPVTKKKRKIPVVFEYEADELEAAALNGVAGEDAASVSHGRKMSLKDITSSSPPAQDAGDSSTPVISVTPQKKAKTPGSDFITFQSSAAVPTPLFCKTTASPGSKKRQTPKSESKKVTFGLKNNKTAEFKKTDRSLLLSPDGSSRVPFDPRQKPKFGVLKSSPMLTFKKIKGSPRKGAPATPKTKPKRRPTAADFF